MRRRGNRTTVVHLKATIIKDVIIITNTPVGRGYNFSVNDIVTTGSTTHTNFEQLRINKVVVNVIPEQTNTLPQNLATGPYLPTVIDAVDYNDDTAPTDSQAVLRLNTSRVHVGDKAWHRKFTPGVSVAAFTPGATTIYQATKFKQWVNTSSVQLLEHYGYKIFIAPATGQTGTFKFTVWAKIYYSCKGIH